MPRKRRPERSLCGTCDAIYDPNNAEEAKIHEHPEPQSGPPRDAWLASKLPYEVWIERTVEGAAWAKMREQTK